MHSRAKIYDLPGASYLSYQQELGEGASGHPARSVRIDEFPGVWCVSSFCLLRGGLPPYAASSSPGLSHPPQEISSADGKSCGIPSNRLIFCYGSTCRCSALRPHVWHDDLHPPGKAKVRQPGEGGGIYADCLIEDPGGMTEKDIHDAIAREIAKIYAPAQLQQIIWCRQLQDDERNVELTVFTQTRLRG